MNCTFATAFYDIGRGRWSSYKRTVEDYMNYFSTVSKLKANLVIFCDEQHKEMISRIRGESEITKIVTVPFEQCEIYRNYYSRISEVMNSELFKSRIIHKDIPEMNFPEYNIVNFNKICFVEEAMKLFDTKNYGWIDFGFGHGRVDVSMDLSFMDQKTLGDRIYMGCLRKPIDQMLYHPWSYFSNEIFITGSAFVGNDKSVVQFKHLACDVIDKSLSLSMIDDDQTIYNMAYLLNKNLFNLKVGSWFNQFGG
jgi:protein YibB